MISEELRIVEIKRRYKTASRDIEDLREPVQGFFHRWGERLDYVTGHGSQIIYAAAEVVGIVETESGQVYEVPADSIRFLDRDND